MSNQNISHSIHLFDFEGQQIAFNGDTYKVALVDEVGLSAIRHYEASENIEASTLNNEIYSFLLNDSGPLPTLERSKSMDIRRLDMICLLVTSKCNLKCDYCFNDQGSYSFIPIQNMDEKTAINAVNFLLNNCGEHATISFFGGEPTLRYSFIKKVVEYSEEKAKNKVSLTFSIATNGILITDEIAQFLKLHNFVIVYSIDGGDAIHDYHRKFSRGDGSFQKVIQGAKRVLDAYDAQNKIVFRGTYTHQNREFNDAFLQLINIGLKNISIEPAVGNNSDLYAIKPSDIPDISRKYRELAKNYWQIHLAHPDVSFFHLTNLLNNLSDKQKHATPCGASTGYLTIAPDGDIYPCHRIVDAKYKLGNINEIPVNQPLINTMQNEFYNATVENRPECRNCWAKWLCGGSCYASNVNDQKNIFDVHPVDCALTKTRIEVVIWLYLQQELLKENLNINTIKLDCHIKIFGDVKEASLNITNNSCGKFCELIGCQVGCQSCETSCTASCTSSCTTSCTGWCTTSCEPFF